MCSINGMFVKHCSGMCCKCDIDPTLIECEFANICDWMKGLKSTCSTLEDVEGEVAS
jgi:hypothetical protein